MSTIKVAVLGAGSTRCTIPVIASLAVYFGERPLEISLYDSDEERLDLFDRFARLCFLMTRSTHSLKATTDYHEALAGADRVIIQIGENCARKELGVAAVGREANDVELLAVELIEPALPLGAEVLDLMNSSRALAQGSSFVEDWPLPPESEKPYVVALQVLRWLNGEEYPFEVFNEQEKSPVKQWLDDPCSLPLRVARPI
jgi:hypothetical protein